MQELNFDLGLEKFTVNGRAETEFNPTDVFVLEEIFTAISSLDGQQAAYHKGKGEMSPSEFFRFARELDTKMRATLDGIFGAEFCAGVYGRQSLYSYHDGIPVWLEFLLVVLERMEKALQEANGATDPRIRQITEKYTKKYHK